MKLKRIIGYTTKKKVPGVFTKQEVAQIKEQPMKDNIYEDTHIKQHLRKWERLHKTFKLRLLMPALYTSKRLFLPKKQVIPDKPWNDNIHIFNKSFEKALETWLDQYIIAGNTHTNKYTKERRQALLDGEHVSIYFLRILKEHTINMALNDTAYREFLNVLMFTISNEMNTMYNKKDYPSGVGHLFYAQADPYDVHYKILFKRIRQQLEISMPEIADILKQKMEA